ncbi:hypothetical protein STEG23_038349 [Scotinomys teguina]
MWVLMSSGPQAFRTSQKQTSWTHVEKGRTNSYRSEFSDLHMCAMIHTCTDTDTQSTSHAEREKKKKEEEEEEKEEEKKKKRKRKKKKRKKRKKKKRKKRKKRRKKKNLTLKKQKFIQLSSAIEDLALYTSPGPHCTLVNDILFAICSFSSSSFVPVHPGADPAAQVAVSRLPLMQAWQDLTYDDDDDDDDDDGDDDDDDDDDDNDDSKLHPAWLSSKNLTRM